MLFVRNKLKERLKNKIVPIMALFLVLFFVLNLQQTSNIDDELDKESWWAEVIWRWYNITQKKYINEKDNDIRKWDILERTIIVKNNKNTSIDSIRVKDTNSFNEKTSEFNIDLKWKKAEKISYDIVVGKEIDKLVESIEFKPENTIGKTIQRKEIVVEVLEQKEIKSIWSINSTSLNSINNDFDQYLEIYWTNLDIISNVLIRCSHKTEILNISKKTENKVWVSINAWSLEVWQCEIWAIFNNLSFFSWISISVTKTENIDNDINVRDITPNTISSSKWWPVVFQWKWFEKIIAVQMENWVIFDLQVLKIINSNVMIVAIPKWLEKKEYLFRLLTKDWIFNYSNKLIIN